ncbi:hypothetical protein HAX54_049084, partial [Datura stramonium]|nr:hypothetical protein [Datura stramonium]
EDLALGQARGTHLLGAKACVRQPCPSAIASAQQLLPRDMAGAQQLSSRCVDMCYATLNAAVARGNVARLVQRPKLTSHFN